MKCVWVMMMFLHGALSQLAKFEVKGPGAPVVATVGSDVILPCSIKPLTAAISKSAVDRSIKWTKLESQEVLVHFYENRKDSNSGQSPQFAGRTSLLIAELQNGNTSLRLTRVKVDDEGEYKCRVDSVSWFDDVSFDLKVEVVGTPPVITVEGYDKDSEEFSLLCKSKGWWPEPDLQWLDSKGNSLPAGVTESHRVAELFSVTRRITVRPSAVNMFFCRVTVRDHMMEKVINASSFYVVGERPVITVDSYTFSGDFTLLCESGGWWPQPEVQWVNCDGDVLGGGVTESLRDAELFGVKSRLALRYNEINTIFCRVTSGDQNIEQRIKSTTIHEHLPPPPPIAKILAGVLVPVIIIAIVAAGLYIHKVKQRKREVDELRTENQSLNKQVEEREREIESKKQYLKKLDGENQSLNEQVEERERRRE